MFLLFAALLPAFVLMVYVYRKDRIEKEPIGLIVRVFVLGALSALVAALVENILFEVFESTSLDGVALIILENFIGVAMVEEGCKFLALNTMRKNPAFTHIFDAIVYGVAAALGFAALENIFYVLDGGMEVAVTRALFSVPGHAADGVIMGCFYGMARQRELTGNKQGARFYYLLAFVLPTIEHGFYDAALSSDSDAMVFLALFVDVVFIVVAAVLVRRFSKRDVAFHKPGGAAVQQNPQQWQQPGAYRYPQTPGQQSGQPYPQQPAGSQPVQQPQPYQQSFGAQPYPQQPFGAQPVQQPQPQPHQQQAAFQPNQAIAQQPGQSFPQQVYGGQLNRQSQIQPQQQQWQSPQQAPQPQQTPQQGYTQAPVQPGQGHYGQPTVRYSSQERNGR